MSITNGIYTDARARASVLPEINVPSRLLVRSDLVTMYDWENNSFPTGTSALSLVLTGLTVSRAVVTNAGNVLTSSATTATQIGYLSTTTSDIQTQINAKLNLSGGTIAGNLFVTGLADFVDGDFSGNVAFGGNLTLALLTASRAVVSDGSKVLVSSATTATQIGYLSGATGTTGTTTTNLVFSTSPTIATPIFTGATITLTDAAKTISLIANTAAALAITDGTNAYQTIDTRTTNSGSSAFLWTPGTAPTIASAAGAQYTAATVTPGTFNFTGTTNITAAGIGLAVNQVTLAGNGSLTVSQSSTLYVTGAVKASSSSGTQTLSTSAAIRIAGGAVNGAGGVVTKAYGLYVDAPIGATTNYAAVFVTGNVGIGLTNPGYQLHLYGASNRIHMQNTGASGDNIWGLELTDVGDLLTSGFTCDGNTGEVKTGGFRTNYFPTFWSNGSEKMRLLTGGNFGIGVTAPTAVLHLKAGTATAGTAPLKFTSGPLLGAAAAGAVEFLTDAFYGTITTGAVRKTFAFLEGPIFTTIAQTGKTTTYNNIATVSGGIPSEVATIDSTGLTANVAAATLYAVPASGEGMYCVSAYLVTTTAASASSTMPNAQVIYTDKDSNTAVTLDVSPILGAAGLGQSGTLAANTVGTVFSGTVVIYVKASTTIQYLTTNYASTIAGMAYALRMKLEAL